MNKGLVYGAAFLIVFAVCFGIGLFFGEDAQAKPTQCLLAVEPFLYCQPHPSCHEPGAMMCWECLGITPGSGAPCLCRKLGCMVP
jgi:hypothetical protein